MFDPALASAGPYGTVFFVGTGPGNPELLTLKALRLFDTADVVVHDHLIGSEVLELVPAGTPLFDVGKACGRHPLAKDQIIALLERLASQHARVVRLKAGDPFFFGGGAEEAASLARLGFAVEVVPGVTSAAGSAAQFGIPLTYPGLANAVQYVTGHPVAGQGVDFAFARAPDPHTTLVVYMGLGNAQGIADALLRGGLSPQTPVAILARASMPDATARLTTLERLADDLAKSGIQPPGLLIVGQVVSLFGTLGLREIASGS